MLEKNKSKLVAISLRQDKVFVVKNVSEQEYKELLNNQSKVESEQDKKEKELNAHLEKQDNRLKGLEINNLFLVKSIYDNFVVMGLIENDIEFQKRWFDYYFNDKELSIENCPKEFTKILVKAGGLK